MPSTYSNLKIQLMATGENNTSWGDVTNLNLGTAIEEAIVGTAAVAFSSADRTLTLTDTNATQVARNMRLNLTGTATAGYNLTVPSISKPYVVNNGTDGTITVKTAAGTGVAVPSGKTMWLFNSGTDVADAITHHTALSLGTALAVSSGGTGGTTQATARAGIGAAGSGTNTDITALNASGGIVSGSPTGGAKGTGTINATGIYLNGTPLTAGGLSYWTEGVNTSSPNATVPANYFTINNAATNVDAVFNPKGTGALLAQVPDSTATGGNKRGANATDLQTLRTTATQVASGTGSIIVGGAYNTASGVYSTALGYSGTASGGYSFTAGFTNVASGSGSVALGASNTASGDYSVATGNAATTRGLYSARAHMSGSFAATGDAQMGMYIARASTTNATTTTLTLNGSTATSSTQIVLPNDSTYVFNIFVSARRTDVDNESAGYQFTGVIDRNTNAASTAIVGTVTKTVIAEDTVAWDANVDAETTFGSLRIQVTGEAGKTIRWVAVVNTVEVVG